MAMTRDEQRDLVVDLALAVVEDIEKKALEGLLPSWWDGHELRKYLADKFSAQVTDAMKDGRSKRVKDYNNVIAINNL